MYPLNWVPKCSIHTQQRVNTTGKMSNERWALVTIQQNTWIRYLLRAAFLIYPSFLARTNDLSLRGTRWVPLGKSIADTYFTMQAALKQSVRQKHREGSERSKKRISPWINTDVLNRTCESSYCVPYCTSIVCHYFVFHCVQVKKRLFNFSYLFFLYIVRTKMMSIIYTNLYIFYMYIHTSSYFISLKD